MPGSESVWKSDIVCPYFVRTDGKTKIKCESLYDSCHFHLVFDSSNKLRTHAEKYCMNLDGYWKCKYCEFLDGEYSD